VDVDEYEKDSARDFRPLKLRPGSLVTIDRAGSSGLAH